MEEVALTLYHVRKCGFYDDSEDHHFATLAETVHALLRWTAGLASVGESSTYNGDEDLDILRAFCLDLRDIGHGRYLLSTWNELQSIEEGVQVLQVQSQIGAPAINAIAVDALSLPGYPAYFCIDTRHRRILNLRFDQRLNGSRQFQRFVSGFLASMSPWCAWDEFDDEKLLGYSDLGETPPEIVPGLVAKFATSLGRVGAQEDYIRAHHSDIRKIVRRATIDPLTEAHKTFLDRAFEIAGLPVNNRLRAEINFQYEFKTRLTPVKLESVIAEFERHGGDSWDDVGFVFARESQKIHWLSGAIARKKEQVDIRRSANGMIDIDELAEWITENLERVLGTLNE